MHDDATLLRRYAEEKSEEAFAELVRRYFDLVYSAAGRRLGGDTHRAEDVAQRVFTTLARDAAKLARHPVLVAWLYAATRHAAIDLLRAEHRRWQRETEASLMSDGMTSDTAPEAVEWERLRPLLDEAMDELGERDREAVLLRFFARRSFREIGDALQIREDAARSSARQMAAADPAAKGDLAARHPEVRRAYLEKERANALAKFLPLLRELGLSPAQTEEFASLVSQGTRTTNYPGPDGGMVSLSTAGDSGRAAAGLRELLGEEGYRRFEAFKAVEPAWKVARELATSLYHTDTPLTSQQARQLVEVLAESRVADSPPRTPDYDWATATAKARGVLSEAQLAVFGGLRAQHEYMHAMQRAMMQAMNAGGRR